VGEQIVRVFFELLMRASVSLSVLLLLEGVYIHGFVVAIAVACIFAGATFGIGTVLRRLESNLVLLIEFLSAGGLTGLLIGFGSALVGGLLVVDMWALITAMIAVGGVQALAGLAMRR
jgi:hypothetical protein